MYFSCNVFFAPFGFRQVFCYRFPFIGSVYIRWASMNMSWAKITGAVPFIVGFLVRKLHMSGFGGYNITVISVYGNVTM